MVKNKNVELLSVTSENRLSPPRSFAEIRQRFVAAEISLRSGALTKMF